MSVETLRYCDLCGGDVDTRAGVLVVPNLPTGTATEYALLQQQAFAAQMGPQWQVPQLAAPYVQYDVCRGCLDGLLAHRLKHREAARAKASDAVRAQQAGFYQGIYERRGGR